MSRSIRDVRKPLLQAAVALMMTVGVLVGCSNPLAVEPRGLEAEAGAKAVLAAPGTGPHNYGEALQKAIYFYDQQRSGFVEGPQNRVSWRGNAFTNDGADVGVDLTGGWHDAGDHIKFNLPMSYSAGTLLWSVYENKDAYVASGQYGAMLANIRWATDYLVKTHVEPNTIYYQVSNKAYDHNFWGSGEVFDPAKPRPSYKLDLANPGSAVAGDMAATFALGYLVFKDSDPTYAATLLRHAKDAFTFANTTRSDAGYKAADGMYNSWSGYWDELLWASTWLHLATGEVSYLTLAESFVPKLNKQGQSTDIEYQWAHCWDDKHYGALLLLARITGKAIYTQFIEMHLDWWAAGARGKTPAGLSWMSEWGSLRYASTAAFLALVYAKDVADPVKKSRYTTFGETQINYILGTNPQNFSYMIGFGSAFPLHPHHRDSHGSWSDQMGIPANHRHTLVGALVGGPASANDGSYTDSINDFQANEVATDYNAGFVGALSFLYKKFGGSPLANFPVAETPDGPEFFTEASVNSAGSTYTELKILTNNRSAWPARYGKKLSFRYYFDISELVSKGYSSSDISVSTSYVEFPVTRKLVHYKDNQYYVEVQFTNDSDIVPRSQSAFAGEVQLRIAGPLGTTIWDPSNDYSYQGLSASSASIKVTENIPLYSQGTLIFGKEPGPTIPDTTAPSVPRGLSLVSTTPTSAKIDWLNNPELDVASYEVHLARSADLSLGKIVSSTTISEFTASNLLGGTTYFVAVLAKDASGNASALSPTISWKQALPDTIPPLKPEGLIATEVQSTSVKLAWTPGTEQDIASYRVYVGPSLSFAKAEGRLVDSPTTAGLVVSGLSPTTRYYYRVSAVDTSGNEGPLSTGVSVLTTQAQAATFMVTFIPTASSTSTNSLGGRYVIKNTGTTALALSTVAIGYFGSSEGKSFNAWIDHAGGSVAGSYQSFTAKVAARVTAISRPGSDIKLHMTFDATAPSLSPGDQVEVQWRMTSSDWSNFNPSNDWTYVSPAKIAVYLGGTLVMGLEP